MLNTVMKTDECQTIVCKEKILRNILFAMILLFGACSTIGNSSNTTQLKETFISLVACKGMYGFEFYDNGNLEIYIDISTEEVYMLYEVIDSNTAIYRSCDTVSNDSDEYYYLQIMVKDDYLYFPKDTNNTSVESAKLYTFTDDDNVGKLTYANEPMLPLI